MGVVATLISTLTVKHIGRRTLLLIGHLLLTFIHLFVALFNILNIDIGVLIMILLFMLVYMNTSGPVAWIYATETCTDAGLGINRFMLYFTVILLSMGTPVLMDPSSIGPNATFFIFAGF